MTTTSATRPQHKFQTYCSPLAEFLGYLRSRWLDESEYEDFAEYKAAWSKRTAEHGVTGFLFAGAKTARVLDINAGLQYDFTVSRGSIKWREIKRPDFLPSGVTK